MSNATKRPEPMFPIDLENAPTITLAGRQWPVPELAIKQAREITIDLMVILPKISAMQAARADDPSASIAAMASFDRDTLERLSSIVFWALKRAMPGLSRNEFEEMPIRMSELIEALPTIIQQVGFVKAAPAGVPHMGEDQEAPELSTGTD